MRRVPPTAQLIHYSMTPISVDPDGSVYAISASHIGTWQIGNPISLGRETDSQASYTIENFFRDDHQGPVIPVGAPLPTANPASDAIILKLKPNPGTAPLTTWANLPTSPSFVGEFAATGGTGPNGKRLVVNGDFLPGPWLF